MSRRNRLSYSPPETSAILALGGGGARGLAHFGVLKATLRRGLVVSRVVGTSMGSLVGAVFATSESVDEAIAKSRNYLASDAFQLQQQKLGGAPGTTRSGEPRYNLLGWYDYIKNFLWARHLLGRLLRRRSLLGGQVLADVVEALVPDIDIRECYPALSIVAVDLRSGKKVVLERGSLRQAVLASTAIPGIFPPQEMEGMLLSDVGVLQSLPTEVAQSYRRCPDDLVIASDVGPILNSLDDCPTALHVLLRIDEIGERILRRASQRLADVWIRPQVGERQWFDFSDPMRIVESGQDAARQAFRSLGNPQQRSSLAS